MKKRPDFWSDYRTAPKKAGHMPEPKPPPTVREVWRETTRRLAEIWAELKEEDDEDG